MAAAQRPVFRELPTTGSFKQESVRSGAIVLLGQVSGAGLQLGTTIVLARLLSPADYGLQTMVLSMINFLTLFRDAGLSSAAIQRENLTHEQASTLFWINSAVGFALAALSGIMAPVLASFYRDPRLFWVTIASSVVFIFNGIATQHHALLDRSLRFGASVKIAMFSGVAGTAVAIVMAERGFGYWALIGQNIVIPVVDLAAVWIALPWVPGRPRGGSDIYSMLRFGGTVSLNSVVVYFAYNTEKILLGRYWGATALGIYGRAYQLISLPVQQLLSSISSVSFPVLSRMQNDLDRLRRSYLKFHAATVSITIPAVVSCALFSNEIVRVLLGPKWVDAGVVLRLLAPTFLVLAAINPLSWYLRAVGWVGRNLRIAFILAPVVILGVAAGIQRGPMGVAAGYSIAMVVLAGPLVAWAKYRTVITTSDFLGCIQPPLVSSVAGGAFGILFKMACAPTLPKIGLLTGELVVFFGVYAAVLLLVLRQKAFYFDVLAQLLHRHREVPEIS